MNNEKKILRYSWSPYLKKKLFYSSFYINFYEHAVQICSQFDCVKSAMKK